MEHTIKTENIPQMYQIRLRHKTVSSVIFRYKFNSQLSQYDYIF